jgi:hypothetical protein
LRKRAGEGPFSVLFPSDCRICGLLLLNISRLLVFRQGKRRHRGFKQVELMAEATLKVHPGRERRRLATGILDRTREIRSQIGLNNHRRRENMRGTLAVARAPLVTGRDVLLVDHVYTPARFRNGRLTCATRGCARLGRWHVRGNKHLMVKVSRLERNDRSSRP